MQNQSNSNWADNRATDGQQLAVLSRHEQVAARIAEGIRVGRFLPGQRLPSERVLAEELGVGRAAVREAIASLQLLEVVDTRQGAGSFVAGDAVSRLMASSLPAVRADTSPSALLDARLLLEPGIAAAAAASASGHDSLMEHLLGRMDEVDDYSDPQHRLTWDECDRLFHRQIAVMAGNEVLLSLSDVVAATMEESLWKRLRDDSIAVNGRMRLHAAEHRLIYEAIVRGDATAAAFFVREHLLRVRRYMALD